MKNRVLLILLAVVLVVSLVAFAACEAEEGVEHSLKITTIGGGTTSPKPGTSTFTEGESVTITAKPDEGKEFDSWEGDASGTNTSITVKMTSDKSVVAVFVHEVIVEEFEWPDRLAIICTTGVGVAATTGWTSEMAKGTGVTIRVVPEGNTMLRFRWLQEGRFFCGMEGASTIRDVLEATKGYAVRDGGPYQLRIIWSHALVDAGFMVRGDSEIETIYDIKPGHKFVDLVPVPGYWLWVEGLLAWVGVDADDIVRVPASSSQVATRLISGGQADGMFYFPATPYAMEASAAPHGIRWLDLPANEDPEGAKIFLGFQPTAEFGVMSQSPECKGVLGIVAKTPLMTRDDADPELVYHFATWMDENYDLYKDNHIWNQYMTIDVLMDVLETWFIPAHDGLITYLKEKGLWTAAHDTRQAQNIEFVTRYVEAFQEAIDLAYDTDVDVDPENEEWIELWENHKERLGLPKTRMYIGLEE